MVLLGLVALGVLSLPPVQRGLGAALVRAADEAAAWDVSAGEAAFRPWPARLDVRSLTLGASGEAPIVEVGHAEARWSWLALLGHPRRIASVLVEDVTVRQPAVAPADEPRLDRGAMKPGDLFGTVVLDSVTVRDVSGALHLDGTEVVVEGARMTASLGTRRAVAELAGARLKLQRGSRRLPLGVLDASLRASPAGVTVEHARLEGGALHAEVTGRAEGPDWQQSASAALRLDASAAELADFWDPELAARLVVQGRVQLDGTLQWRRGSDVVGHLGGVGRGLSMLGLGISRLSAEAAGGRLLASVQGDGWGSLAAWGTPARSRWQLVARLDEASLETLRGALPAAVEARLPRGLSASGTVAAAVDLPLSPGTVSGMVDVRLDAPSGEVVAVRARLSDGRADVERALVRLPHGLVQVHGSVGQEGADGLEVELWSDQPGDLWPRVRGFASGLPELPVAGGPLLVRGTLSGPWESLQLDGGALWLRPEAGGRRLRLVGLGVRGDLDEAHWRAAASFVGGGVVRAEGVVSPRVPSISGTWDLVAVPAPVLASLAGPQLVGDTGGILDGAGTLAWAAGGPFEVAAAVGWRCPQWDGLVADALTVTAVASSDGIRVDEARLDVAGGAVTANGTVDLSGGSPLFHLRVGWNGVEPRRLAPQLPALADGSMSGDLVADGTLAAPEARGSARFAPADASSPVGPVSLSWNLADGRIQVLGRTPATAVGGLTLEGAAGLGSFPALAKLWPAAPSDPLTVHLEGRGLDGGALLAPVGFLPEGAELSSDVVLDARWNPTEERFPRLHLELPNLTLGAGTERLVATETPVVDVEDGVATLQPVTLRGARSELHAQGSVDLEKRTLSLGVHGTVAPILMAAAIPQMRVRGPLSIDADLRGPLSSPTGRLVLDHGGGTLFMADPPVELADLHLELELGDGVVDITDGSVRLNQGRVEIGGGWNPAVQQGVVLELDSVSFLLPMGILSRWNGLLAVEPRPGGRMAVVGDLFLERGLWDRRVDLAKLVAEQVAGAAAVIPDYTLEQVGLDLEVHGRGGIQVDNNLGDFRLRWSTLDVGGTALNPAVQGQITVVPGGELRLGGSPVSIERGRIDFSGEPGAAPEVEIVTATPLFQSGSAASQSLNLGDLLQASAASAVVQAFGVRDTGQRPVDIAAETNTDPATSFTVAQYLGPNAVLFLTTDLGNVQDRTSLLQLWHFGFLKGLVLQAFSSSSEGDGGAVLQRVQWGGSTGEKGPTVGTVTLEGEWPASKRKLKNEMDISKGRTYDPFLLFVGEVRLTRALAGRGYPDAKVTGKAGGDEHRKRLEYTVEPGPYQPVEFRGDSVSGKVRTSVAAEHRSGWLEPSSFETMQKLLEQELAAKGYPFAAVTVGREDDVVVVQVERGEELHLTGPQIANVPVEVVRQVEQLMGSPVQLAGLIRHQSATLERLRGLLAASGYPDAVLGDITVEREGKEHGVVYVQVQPGERTLVARVSVDGSDPLGVVERPDFPLRSGVPLRRKLLDTAERRVRSEYRAKGYPEVKVAAIAQDTENGRADVVVRLDPGSRLTIAKVEFSGIKYLHQKVVERGVTVEEGNLLRPSDLDETAARLAEFAPVDRVDVTWEQSGSSSATVHVDLREKARWTAGGGVRWSSDRGSELILDLRDDDLLGRGLKMDARGRWGGKVRGSYLWIEQPPLPGSNLSLGLATTYERTDMGGDLLRSQTTVSLEAALRRAGATQWRAYIRDERTHDFERHPDFFLPYDVRTNVVSVGGQLVQDTRDHPFDPRSGHYASLDLSYSPKYLGSDLNFVRALGSFSIASQPISGWTWAQSLRLGIAHALSGELTSTVRFLAGGENTIRGFDYNSVGPVEILGGSVIPNGGGALFILNEEVRIPVTSWGRAAVFTDMGQVWDDWSHADTNFAVGAGVGIRVTTPVGMLRGDVAWPLSNRGANRGAHFYLGIGQTF